MVEVGVEAARVYGQLLRGGVIVRPLAGYGLPRHLRISIGLPEQNDRLLALGDDLFGNQDLFDRRLGRNFVHHVQHRILEDRAQPAGA